MRFAAELAFRADEAAHSLDHLGSLFARVGKLFGECKIDGEKATSNIKAFQSIKRRMLAEAASAPVSK